MQIDKINATGNLTIEIFDVNGTLTDIRYLKNLVVTVGKNFIASRMASATASVMTHMSVGSSTTAATLADTDLVTMVGSRVALTSATVNTSTVTYVGTFNPGVSTGAITEAGIFNASTAGTMLARTVFPVVNKAAGDTMVITWSVTLN